MVLYHKTATKGILWWINPYNWFYAGGYLSDSGHHICDRSCLLWHVSTGLVPSYFLYFCDGSQFAIIETPSMSGLQCPCCEGLKSITEHSSRTLPLHDWLYVMNLPPSQISSFFIFIVVTTKLGGNDRQMQIFKYVFFLNHMFPLPKDFS